MAGEIRKPAAFQKLLHRFLMLRPVTAFFTPWIHRIDNAILKWTGGRLSAAQLVGWPVIQLTTVGAKTGQRRTLPLVVIFDEEKLALVASSMGRVHHPGWYYNLKAHPECEVSYRGRSQMYVAREASADEYERYWKLAVSYYAGYDVYKQRAAHRHIPIMVLEPKQR